MEWDELGQSQSTDKIDFVFGTYFHQFLTLICTSLYKETFTYVRHMIAEALFN